LRIRTESNEENEANASLCIRETSGSLHRAGSLLGAPREFLDETVRMMN
jgi:hypothetical protein